MAISIQCEAETVYTETRSSGYNHMYIEVDIDSSEADTVFDCISEYVDHDAMMKRLSREEVIKFFEIEETPDA